MYNPVTDNFTSYEAPETPKVELDLPLLDSPMDISDWSLGIGTSGIPIVKSSINQETINDRNPFIPSQEESDSLYEEPKSQSSLYNFNNNISDRRKQAFEFFKANGFSDIHAAGIVGSLTGESGKQLNPKARNQHSRAFGIAQWLGARQKALFARYGKNPTFEQQLEFILEELNSSEKNALNHLLSTKSVADATRSFTSMFERPSKKEIDSSIKTRISNAEELFKK